MPQKSILSVTTTHNDGAVIQLCYPALHVADDDVDHFFSPFVAGELEKADLEMPLTKVVIHRHGGIISINRDEYDQIVITINFSLRATAAGASIDFA
jgi:hypothetical protein